MVGLPLRVTFFMESLALAGSSLEVSWAAPFLFDLFEGESTPPKYLESQQKLLLRGPKTLQSVVCPGAPHLHTLGRKVGVIYIPGAPGEKRGPRPVCVVF